MLQVNDIKARDYYFYGLSDNCIPIVSQQERERRDFDNDGDAIIVAQLLNELVRLNPAIERVKFDMVEEPEGSYLFYIKATALPCSKNDFAGKLLESMEVDPDTKRDDKWDPVDFSGPIPWNSMQDYMKPNPASGAMEINSHQPPTKQ